MANVINIKETIIESMDAKLSPRTRNVQNLENKIQRLEAYEKW
ncbi:hypothetical protein R0131_14920 [Clostridium sp. AL.422]|nr:MULTISPECIES: hypothetical protein [unclassified Clostridium]MDV4152119.1 hypothetical protein [Clostridium sp. AL.422]